jgi:hypothetical protein
MFNLLLVFGIATLYIGFSGVFGVLIHQTRREMDRRWNALAMAFGALVLAPATLVVLGFELLDVGIGLIVVALGGLAAWAAIARPAWLPPATWHAEFGTRYFASVMALAAVWGLALTVQHPSLGAALVGATALAASLTSLTKATQAS